MRNTKTPLISCSHLRLPCIQLVWSWHQSVIFRSARHKPKTALIQFPKYHTVIFWSAINKTNIIWSALGQPCIKWHFSAIKLSLGQSFVKLRHPLYHKNIPQNFNNVDLDTARTRRNNKSCVLIWLQYSHQRSCRLSTQWQWTMRHEWEGACSQTAYSTRTSPHTTSRTSVLITKT